MAFPTRIATTLLLMMGFTCCVLTLDRCSNIKQPLTSETKQEITLTQCLDKVYIKRNQSYITKSKDKIKPWTWCGVTHLNCSRIAWRTVYVVAFKNTTKSIRQCLPGYYLASNLTCQRCKNETHGFNCTKKCTCKNDGICLPNGLCVCKAGWTGNNCEKACPKSSWGLKCSQTCTCSLSGTYGTCHPITGKCTCRAGYQGVNCDKKCSHFKYGINCSDKCLCNRNTTLSCHHVNGSCNCEKYWIGELCDKCIGQSCMRTCNCKEDRGNCHNETGKCLCSAGYTGQFCEKTMSNKFSIETSSSLALIIGVVIGVIVLIVVITTITFLFYKRTTNREKSTSDADLYNKKLDEQEHYKSLDRSTIKADSQQYSTLQQNNEKYYDNIAYDRYENITKSQQANKDKANQETYESLRSENTSGESQNYETLRASGDERNYENNKICLSSDEQLYMNTNETKIKPQKHSHGENGSRCIHKTNDIQNEESHYRNI